MVETNEYDNMARHLRISSQSIVDLYENPLPSPPLPDYGLEIVELYDSITIVNRQIITYLVPNLGNLCNTSPNATPHHETPQLQHLITLSI